jgi:hypothetical protein
MLKINTIPGVSMTKPFKTRKELVAHLTAGKRVQHEGVRGPFYLLNGSIVYSRLPDMVLDAVWYADPPEKWRPYDAWYDWLPGAIVLITLCWLIFS